MEDFKGKNTAVQASEQEQAKRESRRKVLKTGAALAPLALTLSTGNAMATNRIAVSGAACVSNVKQKSYAGNEELQIPREHRSWMSADHEYEHPERTAHFDDSNEDHWDYLKKHNGDECSCLQSVDAVDYINKTFYGGN
ncbi:hypothetical protein [Emcibacter nanhaiensis]|uniref:Uncharacterized protein n=1 Tax=Emcibacter nanhaiensis TaxID=1505037 RepID=A0A501PAQ8_9PROT|nr:hypothetical protein [Emcibacter nanhaiensis]TPD57315.1 hypothetical protein FIV46_14395 [Emcibacter nanhaiensis]